MSNKPLSEGYQPQSIKSILRTNKGNQSKGYSPSGKSNDTKIVPPKGRSGAIAKQD